MKKLYAVLCVFFGAYTLLHGQNADFYVKGVRANISEDVCLQGGFYDESKGRLTVNGGLCFKNNRKNEVSFALNSDLSNASLHFEGSATTYLEANETHIKNMGLNLTNSDLFLSGQITLSGRMSLISGRILDDGNALLKLADPSESSLVFNDVRNNNNYLEVTLNRAVVPNVAYSYPLGNEESYHPFTVSDVDVAGNITVSYSTTIDEAWAADTGHEDMVFPFSGAWVVDDDGLDASFVAHMYKFDNTDNLLKGNIAALYVVDPSDVSEDPVFEYTLNDSGEHFYTTNKTFGAGMYSLVESEFGLNPEGNDVELVNTIVANSAVATSYFVVPEMQKYQRIDIKVYDSWGRLIFTSKEYANDFNCREYPSGTYYYHMRAILHDGSEIVKDDVIEVLREE